MSCHTAFKLYEQSSVNLLFSSWPFYPTLWNYFCLESKRSYKFKTWKQVSSMMLLFLVLYVSVSHLIPFFNLIYVVSVALDLWFTENCNVNLSFLNIASCLLLLANTTMKTCTFFPVVSSVYLQYFFVNMLFRNVLFWKHSPISDIVCYCNVSGLEAGKCRKSMQICWYINKLIVIHHYFKMYPHFIYPTGKNTVSQVKGRFIQSSVARIHSD